MARADFLIRNKFEPFLIHGLAFIVLVKGEKWFRYEKAFNPSSQNYQQTMTMKFTFYIVISDIAPLKVFHSSSPPPSSIFLSSKTDVVV